MTPHPLFVPTAMGPVAAYARVTPPEKDVRRVAVFLTGGAAHGKQPLFGEVARTLAAHGIASIEFDYPGTGASPSAASYSRVTGAEIVAGEVAAWFRETTDALDTALIGHCFGGITALKVAAQDTNVSRVLGFAMPWRPHKKKTRSRRLRQEIVTRGRAATILARPLSRGRSSRPGGGWFDGVERAVHGVPNECSMQFVYGTHDEFLKDAIEYELVRGLPPNANVITVEGKKLRGFANVEDHATIIEMIRRSVVPPVGADRLRP